MNEKLMRMQSGKGFIAALDQSGGSTPKALRMYGIDDSEYVNDEDMFQLVHEMRTRIMTSPSFTSQHILAAILFENTMDRKVEGQYTADYLWNTKGILPILKVDKGLCEEAHGVRLMKPIEQLDELLQRAKERHIFGTKMRSFIASADAQGIRDIVDQQFALGLHICNAGFIPILEPEIDIFADDKEASEVLLKTEIKKHLAMLPEDARLMFKLSIPAKDGFYSDIMEDPHVVRMVALSGGYTRDEANARLARNPGLVASFSRALTQGLSIKQNEAAFDKMLLDSIVSIYDASMA